MKVTEGPCSGCGRHMILEVLDDGTMVSRHEAPTCPKYDALIAASKTARRLPDVHRPIHEPRRR